MMSQLLRTLLAVLAISAVAGTILPTGVTLPVSLEPLTSLPGTPSAVLNARNSIFARLQAIKQPFIKAAFDVGFSNCNLLKEILGKQSPPPDLSKLSIVFISREVTIQYKLSDAAKLLPTSGWFKPQEKTIIFIHGFTDTAYGVLYKNISNAFLKQGEYNVVALDTSAYLGLETLYFGATTNVPYVGERLGAMLAKMLQVGTKPSALYLIGHSLGAHIAGYAAKYFTRLTGKRVSRITGLDPAGPCYVNINDNLKLKNTDADFVDVIHSDAGVFGIDEVIGQVDFYPNGGSRQAGCLTEVCNHLRVVALYADTVLYPNASPAVACSSWSQFKTGMCNYSDVMPMGLDCPSSARGRYFLQTNPNAPYGRGDAGLHYVLA